MMYLHIATFTNSINAIAMMPHNENVSNMPKVAMLPARIESLALWSYAQRKTIYILCGLSWIWLGVCRGIVEILHARSTLLQLGLNRREGLSNRVCRTAKRVELGVERYCDSVILVCYRPKDRLIIGEWAQLRNKCGFYLSGCATDNGISHRALVDCCIGIVYGLRDASCWNIWLVIALELGSNPCKIIGYW
jgi:hypothetical protein